jgi:hypothetical protein
VTASQRRKPRAANCRGRSSPRRWCRFRLGTAARRRRGCWAWIS